jgi:hypothetical protein
MMGYINDTLDDDQCNVRAVWRGSRCYIVATREIELKEEFLMAYGANYWMRDVWESFIIRKAWDNYGIRRTQTQWRELYHRRVINEQEPDDISEDDSEEEEAGERKTVFRRRILIDLTLGEEAVVTVIDEPVTPLIPSEELVFVPYTLDSPEMLEDYTVIRNSCA